MRTPGRSEATVPRFIVQIQKRKSIFSISCGHGFLIGALSRSEVKVLPDTVIRNIESSVGQPDISIERLISDKVHHPRLPEICRLTVDF